jgi:methyl-accepting chemotaxis protein
VIPVLAALLGSVALLGACGESEQEKAQNSVCDARDDIQKHVDDLAGLTITSASIDQVTNHLKAIRDDLKKIADERDELSDDQRKDVEQAAQRFESELRSAAGDVVSGTASGEEAGKRAGAALDELANSFKQAYGPLDCD